MAFAVENICGFLIRSQLMTPEEMRSMYQRWQTAAGAQVGQLPAFLKWLVASGYVTEYQANLLGQGHADGFYLNQYQILERIGRGRMAGVFKAVHQLGQVVAIKVLPPSRAKDAKLLARFQREAQMALRLKHPNVVRSFQVGASAAGVHYLVMEYLEGDPVDELLRRKPTLPPAEAVRLAHQALLGLQHIHEQGMVHRDIKPANLFLVASEARSSLPTVKILDIGLGRELFEEPVPGAAVPRELTVEGVLLGTPDYLAPEQARDPRRCDIRADIYSVGCVLYQMLVGQTPFPDKNLFNQIVRHATEPPRPLRSFNPAIPEGLEQIVAWMMAKQPEQRYPTPARAAQALEVFLLIGGERAAAVEEAPQMRRYLTWLELGEPSTTATEATLVGAPVAAPVQPKAAPAVPLAAPVVPVRPASAPALPSPDEIDVELVPPLELKPPAAPAIKVPPRKRAVRGNSRAIILAIVAGVLILSCSCALVVGLVVKNFM